MGAVDDADVLALAECIRAYEARAATYDELFEATSASIRARGRAGKADLAALAFWKRLNCNTKWVASLLQLPESVILDVTGSAFEMPDCRGRFQALERLPGFRNWGPFASTLLCAYDPQNYAVRDRRTLNGLGRLGVPIADGRGVAVRYHERVEQLRDVLRQQPGWSDVSARQVDKGLFELGA
jgi:hypothetical protein